MSNPLIGVTAASGQLGRLVIEALLRTEAAERVIPIVRRPAAAADFAARGLEARVANYADQDAMTAALAGVDRLLLISSSEIGQRTAQHRSVIAAAKRAGVSLIAYTSVLHADTSILSVAEEHRETEAALRESGIPTVLLRNGWYTENRASAIAPALAHGVVLGSAREGRIASAARADYADAAAAVLTAPDAPADKVLELAGDTAYTLADFAAEIARQSGRPVAYKDLPARDYEAALLGAGVPAPFTAMLAGFDTATAQGALDDSSGTLGRLIGRPTTPLATSVAAMLAARDDAA